MDKFNAKNIFKTCYQNAPLKNNSTLCICALSFAGCHSKMDITRNIILHFGKNKTSKIDVIPVVINFVPLQQIVYTYLGFLELKKSSMFVPFLCSKISLSE